VTAARRKAQGELLTLTEAARRCGVSRSRLRRALDDELLPNAVQDDDERGTWRVPVTDLVAAGLLADGAETEQVVDSPRTGRDRTGGQVADSSDDVPAGVGLVKWEDVQGLVGQLVTAQDDRARAETELRVAQFQLQQAQAELQRLRDERAATQAPEGDPGGRTGWLRRR